MAMVVNHNLPATNAYRHLGINNSKMSKSIEKLSSGLAINRAGDDAAGLAVSEKMRAQISGLNQAVKNAQDGISMVQTYEGALTETDSILQRMRTLAAQSANGTYQDDVDREAIQLEFDQLNDELNQIADTDFNGVVVLNGGKMADGTRAVNGEFVYGKDGTSDLTVAKAAVDISGAQAGTMVDNSKYNKTVADDIWKAAGLDVNKNESVNITFTFDGKNWNATKATDFDGNEIEGANVSNLKATRNEVDTNTGLGGFKVSAGNSEVNVVFDEMNTDGNFSKVKEGDTVTIRFANTKAANYAPNNIGFDESTAEFSDDAAHWAKVSDKTVAVPKIKINSELKDSAMSADLKTALDTLNNDTKIKVTYADGVPTVAFEGTPTDLTLTDNGGGSYTINYAPAGGDAVKLADINVTDFSKTVVKDIAVSAVFSNPALSINNATGLPADVTTPSDTAPASVTYTYYDAAANQFGDGTAGWSSDGVTKANFTVKGGVPANGDTLTYTPAWKQNTKQGFDGEVTLDINVDAYNYTDLNNITAQSVKTPASATMEAAVSAKGVSKSNSNDASTATLTYTDNITLQVGARTKDSVNFTFSYKSDGLGELKADLDCSARGLGTDKLSLLNQKDANTAIDKIDNAINKVSMVRGSFGAMQNRLEHKVDNLNVASENLTAAESAIRDTDMAKEMMNFTKSQILSQASQAMLAQANQLPQGVLQLLQ